MSKICRNHLGTQEFRPKKGKKWDKKKTERKIEVTLVFSYDIALKILPPTELTATQLLPKKIHLLWDNPDGVWPPHRVYPVGVFFPDANGIRSFILKSFLGRQFSSSLNPKISSTLPP